MQDSWKKKKKLYKDISIRINAEDHGREPVGESVRFFWVEIV